MKKIMMIAAMMLLSVGAFAQNEVGQFTLKPMAGVNLATLTKTDDSKLRVGLAAGVEAEYGVAENFSLSLGALYSMQGVKFTEKGSGATLDVTYKLSRDLPLKLVSSLLSRLLLNLRLKLLLMASLTVILSLSLIMYRALIFLFPLVCLTSMRASFSMHVTTSV